MCFEPIKEILRKRGKRIITLVQHGEYKIRSDCKEGENLEFLTNSGIEQAQLMGKRLNQTGTQFDQIYCSESPR